MATSAVAPLADHLRITNPITPAPHRLAGLQGDRYLPPNAVPARAAPAAGPVARVNQTHAR